MYHRRPVLDNKRNLEAQFRGTERPSIHRFQLGRNCSPPTFDGLEVSLVIERLGCCARSRLHTFGVMLWKWSTTQVTAEITTAVVIALGWHLTFHSYIASLTAAVDRAAENVTPRCVL